MVKRTSLPVIACLLLAFAALSAGKIMAQSDSSEQKSEMNSRPVEAMLKAKADASSKSLPAKVLEAGQQGIKEVGESGVLEKALKEGDTMPSFELPDANGNIVKSSELLAGGPLVIVFYRGAWCPYCNLYLHALEGYLPDFESLGASLVAISGEPPDRSLSVVEKDSLTFTVLSDTALVAARKFGIVYELPKIVEDVMLGFGLDMKEYYGTPKAELPLSATYVVNKEGQITYSFLEADYKVRAEPVDIIAALKREN